MASAGPNSAGTITSVTDGSSGTNAWGTPSNAGASDNTRTTATVSTQFLKCLNFGFAVPSTATINGISVEVEGSHDGAGRGTVAHMYKAGVLAGTEPSTELPSVETYTQMAPSDPTVYMWGTTWTPAEVNASDFGVGIWAWQTAGATTSIDHVRVTVYYTEASTTKAFRRSLLGVGV